MDDWIRDLLAERIGSVRFGREGETYKFERIKRAKAEARLARPNVPLLDFGVGEPDEAADAAVMDALAAEARLRENRGYADNGIAMFKKAAAAYLRDEFGVAGVDAQREIVPCIGAKSALAMLPSCFIQPGDTVLLPEPGYPIVGTHARFLGGTVHPLPLSRSNGYLPDLSAIPAEALERAKLLYLNYPHNPTGAAASPAFFAEVAAFASRYRIAVVHDAAYAALTTDGSAPLSFLSVPGAKEVGIEVHSLSKSHSMTGWRIGFVAGNPLMIQAFAAMKDHFDSGQFIPIQKAAAVALGRRDIPERNRIRYRKRLARLADALTACGLRVERPKGTFFLYAEAPAGTASGRRFPSAEAFCRHLLEDFMISAVPWDEAGAHVRFSATYEESGSRDVVGELAARLSRETYLYEGDAR